MVVGVVVVVVVVGVVGVPPFKPAPMRPVVLPVVPVFLFIPSLAPGAKPSALRKSAAEAGFSSPTVVPAEPFGVVTAGVTPIVCVLLGCLRARFLTEVGTA